jgi:hypothetical protein
MKQDELTIRGAPSPDNHGWRPELRLIIFPRGNLEIHINDNGHISQTFIATPEQLEQIRVFFAWERS